MKLKKDDTSEKQLLREQVELSRLIFDNIYNGVCVTDPDGYITHFNKPYGTFLGLDPETMIGKHCTDAIENTRMHIVAQTGIPEISQSHMVNGQNMIVQRIPIKKDGKVIAVFGQVMFKSIKDVADLAEKLSLLKSKVKIYEQELLSLRSTRFTFDSIIGVSEAITSLKSEALKAAALSLPVLITGESGTGKELFAQAIHHASPRKIYPFVRVNCSAIPQNLLESEFFGYAKGAFTGANTSGKPGKFELAHRGSIFLDEIGEMPLEMQPKLLRVLDEKEFERIGGSRVIQSDFRLIAATNKNLAEMLPEKQFRMDLFYRLNVIPINIPPLRERREDIMPLARHLLNQLSKEANLDEILINEKAEKTLKNHDWPGNVRELQNVLERTLIQLDGNTIGLRHLPFYLHYNRQSNFPKGSTASPELSQLSYKDIHKKTEEEAIRNVLEMTNNNKAQAAKMLGIHRTHLYKKMKKYNIPLERHTKIS
jgi:PAS domain S-box-containing protein